MAQPPAPRWMTLEETCQELRLPHKIVRRLIRQHRLVGIVSGQAQDAKNWRILDPSEAYKRALNVQESILSHRHAIDLLQFPILSSVEFAELVGLRQTTIRSYVKSGVIKPFKMGRFSLYTAAQVRDFLLYREHREPTARRVRIAALVAWCLKMLEEHPIQSLSADEVKADDALEGSLRTIMRQKEPERGRHLAEFWRRWELAQAVARTIHKSQTPHL